MSIAYAQSRISSAATPSSDSIPPVEIDSSLRVTLTVSSSGKVLVAQSIVWQLSGSGNRDVLLYVQVDGAGAWTQTGGADTNFSGDHRTAYGEVELTGLTPGSHTFYMGWSAPGGAGSTNSISPSGTAVQVGNWQSVRTLT